MCVTSIYKEGKLGGNWKIVFPSNKQKLKNVYKIRTQIDFS